MPDRIKVTGIDPWELLAALHNATAPPPTFVCMMRAKKGDITPEEAKEEALATTVHHRVPPHFPDYLFGRPIKTILKAHEDDLYLVRTDLYDRDAKKGKCLEVVTTLQRREEEGVQ